MRSGLLSIVLILISLVSPAQITAPGSRTSRITDYPSGGTQHPVFIYCVSGPSERGQLNALSPGGVGPFTFAWSQWSESTSSFSIDRGSDTGVMNSTLGNLEEGGYRVHITDAVDYDTSLIAWIHLDKPLASAELLDFKCNYVALSGSAAIDTFFYSDITDGSSLMLPNDFSFLWSSDPSSTIPYPDLDLSTITYDPPLEDLTYNLQVTDSFTCVSNSSFFYESIHVKADFNIDPSQGEAPLEVLITDNSIRALNYEWHFGYENHLEHDTISYLSAPGSHTYYVPGQYKLTLFIESELFCKDSVSVDITVEPSTLNIPNIFTPDGDGNNEFFYVDSKSLRHLVVQIFSKGGQRIYVFDGKGDSLKDWQGWDGKIGSSKASPGIYFYIIRAQGWDDVLYEGEEYRGFFYLYR